MIEGLNYYESEMIYLIHKCYDAASEAKALMISDEEYETFKIAHHLSRSLSFANSAWTLYVGDKDLERNDVAEVFRCFSAFESEASESLTTDHGYQHAVFLFSEFKDAASLMPGLERINIS